MGDLGDKTIPMGWHKGKTLRELSAKELDSFIGWLETVVEENRVLLDAAVEYADGRADVAQLRRGDD